MNVGGSLNLKEKVKARVADETGRGIPTADTVTVMMGTLAPSWFVKVSSRLLGKRSLVASTTS
jgi:hypothetical protein